MNIRKTLMIVGVGDLAGLSLDLLTRYKSIDKIYLASRNVENMTLRKNLSLLTAAQLGFYPSIECIKMDLLDIEQTAALLSKFRPDIIFNTATLQSWRIITKLPEKVYKDLDRAQFGPWVPMHLTLIHKLMKSVKMSGITTCVVNAAFPDATNPILSKVNLAPFTGIGNVANVIPAMRRSVSIRLEVPIETVQVKLVAHHYFSHRIPSYGDAGGSPYFMEIMVNGESTNNELDYAEIISMVKTHCKKTGGAFRQLITASSAVSVLISMINNTKELVHAGGPSGLPGGYPIYVNHDKVKIVLPDGVSLKKAVQINQEGGRFDGIEKIDEDGTVYFTDKEMSVMKKMLGYECSSMALEDSEGYANELGCKYREFSSKYLS